MAIYLSVKHFRDLLEGGDFIIFTDHKPFIYALHFKSDKYNSRQLDYIAQFTSDIRHIHGKYNVVADTLSRASLNTINTQKLDLDYLANEQRKDDTLN